MNIFFRITAFVLVLAAAVFVPMKAYPETSAPDKKPVKTEENVHIMVVAITKYEVYHLQTLVLEKDPHAFIMLNDGERVVGNFKKHLE